MSVISVEQLQPVYTVPANIKGIMRLADSLNTFIRYYDVSPEDLVYATGRVRLERISSHLRGSGIDMDELAQILSGHITPVSKAQRRAVNLNDVMDMLDEHKGLPLTFDLLRQAHIKLMDGLPASSAGGRLREPTLDLFSYQAQGIVLPEREELTRLTEGLLQILQDETINVLVRAWLFYYFLQAIQPFDTENETIGALAVDQILSGDDLDFFSLLNVEENIFFTPAFQELTAELFAMEDYRERLQADLSDYLAACNKLFQKALNEVKQHLIAVVRDKSGFTQMEPRQRNSINFWLEDAFFRHWNKLGQLTERQREILDMLVKNGMLTNRDLVPRYNVDRKTIQRDFNSLLDLGIISYKGAGRSHHYCLDFRI